MVIPAGKNGHSWYGRICLVHLHASCGVSSKTHKWSTPGSASTASFSFAADGCGPLIRLLSYRSLGWDDLRIPAHIEQQEFRTRIISTEPRTVYAYRAGRGSKNVRLRQVVKRMVVSTPVERVARFVDLWVTGNRNFTSVREALEDGTFKYLSRVNLKSGE